MGTGAGGASSYGGTGAGIEGIRGSGKAKLTKPIDKKTKSVTYSTDTPDLLLDLNSAGTANVSKTSPIQAVKVKNEGDVSAIAIFAFSKYEDETTLHGVEYVQYLLNPNDEILLPTTRAIIHDTYAEWDGTAVTATAPNSNEYVDSTANMDNATASGTVGSNSSTTLYLEPYSDEDDCTANLFQVGDLIRATNEIMEVTAIGNKTDLANNYITVRRGVHGSTAASDHSDGDAILLPFFNAYHDFDKYSVAQSDSLGRFKANNFFGYGRSASGQAGLTGGSIAIQFYEAGYAKAGLSDITSNTESGLTASTAYEFDITVDGGTTFDNLSFTVDSSNTKFGGSTGIIAKIQDALDTQYYTSGNLFEKKVTVSIEGGDVVFRSGSSTSASAISLGTGSSGTAEFLGSGRIPNGVLNGGKEINVPVDAKLQTETIFNPVTNSESYKNIFIRDDGRGNLIWKNNRIVGTVNYETGEIDFTLSEKPNAEFVVSVLHTSPFSGKLNSSDADRANSLKQVFGNTPQQKCEAVLTVTTY